MKKIGLVLVSLLVLLLTACHPISDTTHLALGTAEMAGHVAVGAAI